MNHVIVIIEDEPDLAQFMEDVLVDQGYQVFTDTKGVSGMQLVERTSPDMVLLDLKLPDIDGNTICTRIKKNFSNTKVIMITGQDRPEDIARGLNTGADDYIPKPVTPEVLIARVRARLRSGGNQNSLLRVDDLTLDTQSHEVKRGDQSIDLSAQEYKLLEYFMSNPGRVLTRDMILSRIWRGSPDIETRVVDVYVGYLRKKIDFKKPKLFKSIRGFGYMIKEPQEK